jgi:hypothetical protein
MQPSIADFSTILNRILDTAADNLRIAKILVQMGLDPNNITYHGGATDSSRAWHSLKP